MTQLKNLKVFLFFNDVIINRKENVNYISQSNHTILKFLLQNKCRIDLEYNTTIRTTYPNLNELHKDVFCAYCGHGFDLDQNNYVLNNGKILCPISKHEKLCVFKIKDQDEEYKKGNRYQKISKIEERDEEEKRKRYQNKKDLAHSKAVKKKRATKRPIRSRSNRIQKKKELK